jgi:hypothetical protein
VTNLPRLVVKAMDDLAGRVRQIRELFGGGMYTLAAKESAILIEFALRELLRRHTGELQPRDRIRVNQAEIEIGKGEKGIEDMTMGQLAGVLRTSRFFDAWSKATGRDLSSIAMVNLKAVIDLRNRLIHDGKEAGRGEAEMLYNVLRTFLETFGILTLDEAGVPLPASRSRGIRFRSRERSAGGDLRVLGIVGATAVTVVLAGVLLVPGLRLQLAQWLRPSIPPATAAHAERDRQPAGKASFEGQALPSGFAQKKDLVILVDVGSLEPEQIEALQATVRALQAEAPQEAEVYGTD